jgi:hypothetical protein
MNLIIIGRSMGIVILIQDYRLWHIPILNSLLNPTEHFYRWRDEGNTWVGVVCNNCRKRGFWDEDIGFRMEWDGVVVDAEGILDYGDHAKIGDEEHDMILKVEYCYIQGLVQKVAMVLQAST